MFDKFQNEGKGDILSRIREGVSQKPGIYYNEENSYQNILIEKAYGIDISQKNSKNISLIKQIILTVRMLVHIFIYILIIIKELFLKIIII